eukprot:6661756-Alexandrium_andersonii.AAC.1
MDIGPTPMRHMRRRTGARGGASFSEHGPSGERVAGSQGGAMDRGERPAMVASAAHGGGTVAGDGDGALPCDTQPHGAVAL